MTFAHRGPLSRTNIDRQSLRRNDPQALPNLLQDPSTRILVVDQGHLPVTIEDAPRLVTCSYRDLDVAALTGTWVDLGSTPQGANVIGLILDSNRTVPHSDIEGIALPDPLFQALPGVNWVSVRDVGHELDDADVALALSATGLAGWHEDHQYCARCGDQTVVAAAGWARECPGCKATHFPRTDPAVIIAITDPQGRLLLGHAAHWPEGRYSVLAGFVEAGEYAEAAVHREVQEEVGIALQELTYLGSQPWPFPRSLMLAYRATTQESELQVDGVELTEAHWFTPAELNVAVREGQVTLPVPSSIARSMIDAWLLGEFA